MYTQQLGAAAPLTLGMCPTATKSIHLLRLQNIVPRGHVKML
jgi:hypothetical protein